MWNIIFLFLFVQFATLSKQNQHLIAGSLPMLTCEDTESFPHVQVPMNCSAVLSILIKNSCTKVYRSRSGDVWDIETRFLSQPLGNGENLPRDTPLCTTIRHWGGTARYLRSSYMMEFDTRFFIGIVGGTCDESGECVLNLQMRSDVLALPPLSRTPDEPAFWDFSSPMWRARLGWLRALNASALSHAHHAAVLPGLAGSSLQELRLTGSFGSDALGPLPRLQHLPLLRSLTITNSPAAILGANLTLEKLEHLVVSETRIDHWSGNVHRLPCLMDLTLRRCGMRTFSAASSHFPELRRIDISKNMLTFISSDAFAGLTNLIDINLSDNLLSEIPSDLFTSLPYLAIISLQSNNLTDWPKLPCNTFSSISLANNHLKSLINWGKHVQAVSELDISNNNIAQWKNYNIFLKETACEKNKFEYSGSLLKVGNISVIGSSIFSQPWISHLNISRNRIVIFSDEMVQSLSSLEEVDLGGNLIDCGVCQTSLLQRWLGTTQITVKNLGTLAPLTCSNPQEFESRLVEDVNFEEVCFIPRRYLWLGIGAPTAGVIAFALLAAVLFYYRTEVVYLAHLAKVRATTSKRKKTQSESNACYDAFVCYSGKNRKWVLRRLVPILERRPEHYALCLFDRDFRLGTHIVTNIVDAIDQSCKVVVVLTQHFIDSKWCQWELEMAQHKLFSDDREFLVLVELEELDRRRLPRLLRFLLDTRPVVRWPRPESASAVMEAATQLRRALGPSLRQRLVSSAPPPPFEPRPSLSTYHDEAPLLVNDDD